jgi:predicted nucleic acid-binding protein
VPLIVISDSSPIRALNHLDLLSLFKDLYGSVIVPEAVAEELRRPTSTCIAIEIVGMPGFDVRSPTLSPAALGVPGDLDPGEMQAITLALELKADLVLMDERKGTAAARGLGLSTIGVFGMLLEAKRRTLIDRLLPLVDRLIGELRFYVAPALREQLARLAGE